ncbi:MAG: GNAT family N-acetyltransferase [Oscillospiraceae bacterium]|nr:GNAT family N-acetyltransferase [Oscillospiraceae bacterium]
MKAEELRLVPPSEELLEEVRAYREDFLAADSSMDGAGPLRRFEDPAEWLAAVRSFADPATVPAGKVQATALLCVRDGRILGMIQIRHALNEYLERYAGHIGYSVRPSERRKGVAKWMLGAALPFCRQIGLRRVMIACEPWNEGSRRTILANGGVYEKTVHEPGEDIDLEQYWIEL